MTTKMKMTVIIDAPGPDGTRQIIHSDEQIIDLDVPSEAPEKASDSEGVADGR